MLCSILSMDDCYDQDKVTERLSTDSRIWMHYIKYNEILYSLWTVYLKSGTDDTSIVKIQSNSSVWPLCLSNRRVKNNVRQGIIDEHHACLTYVQNRLLELEKDIKQWQINLQNQIQRLPAYSSSSTHRSY